MNADGMRLIEQPGLLSAAGEPSVGEAI